MQLGLAQFGHLHAFICQHDLKLLKAINPFTKKTVFGQEVLLVVPFLCFSFSFNFKNKEFAPLNPLADKSIFQIVSGGTSLPLVNYER